LLLKKIEKKMVESLVNEEKQERLIEKKDSDSKQEKK